MLFVSAILTFSLLVSILATSIPSANLRHASNNDYTALDYLTPSHGGHSKLAYPFASSRPAPMTSHAESISPEVSVKSRPLTKPSKTLTSTALRTLAQHTVLHITQLNKEYNEAHQTAKVSHQVALEHSEHIVKENEKWENTPEDQRRPPKPFREVPLSKEALDWYRTTILKPEGSDVHFYAKFGSPEEWEKQRAAFIQNSYNYAVVGQRKKALLDPDGPVSLLEKLKSVGIYPH